MCVTAKTRHLGRVGQLGEFEQDSNTDLELESNTRAPPAERVRQERVSFAPWGRALRRVAPAPAPVSALAARRGTLA